MAPRFMLIGQIGAGKTTLFNSLFGKEEPARKTQVMEFEGGLGIDTPGEYFSHPRMYHALITVSAEVERLLYVHPADVLECRLPPGLLDVYAKKSIDAVVTKMDQAGIDFPQLERLLRSAGVQGKIFPVSMYDRESMDVLRCYLLGKSPGEPPLNGKLP